MRLNMSVARDLARRYRGRGIPPDDLHQVALLGLVKAVKGFKADTRARSSSVSPCRLSGARSAATSVTTGGRCVRPARSRNCRRGSPPPSPSLSSCSAGPHAHRDRGPPRRGLAHGGGLAVRERMLRADLPRRRRNDADDTGLGTGSAARTRASPVPRPGPRSSRCSPTSTPGEADPRDAVLPRAAPRPRSARRSGSPRCRCPG